jgi:glycerol uptake facilitator-like aquaporin
MNDTLNRLAAEAIGTFTLVFAGTRACLQTSNVPSTAVAGGDDLSNDLLGRLSGASNRPPPPPSAVF